MDFLKSGSFVMEGKRGALGAEQHPGMEVF